jgi:hypothetical protein
MPVPVLDRAGDADRHVWDHPAGLSATARPRRAAFSRTWALGV